MRSMKIVLLVGILLLLVSMKRDATLSMALIRSFYFQLRPLEQRHLVPLTISQRLVPSVSTQDPAKPFVDRADVFAATKESIWLHVDAAWAGVAFALPEYREQGHLRAVNRYADSFCTNFHKVRLPFLSHFLVWLIMRCRVSFQWGRAFRLRCVLGQ